MWYEEKVYHLAAVENARELDHKGIEVSMLCGTKWTERRQENVVYTYIFVAEEDRLFEFEKCPECFLMALAIPGYDYFGNRWFGKEE